MSRPAIAAIALGEEHSLGRPGRDAPLAGALGRVQAPDGQPSLRPPAVGATFGPARRAGGTRAARALAALLIAAGALTLADAAVTLVWQEPISALYAQLRQESLRGDLRALDGAKPNATAAQALARLHEQRRRIEYLAGALEHRARAGSAVGRIRIPSIGASFVVVKGTGTSELQDGPGIYPQTRFPGSGGTTAIAGHRTTYLAPFRHIDELRRGQRIVLEMPYARFTYTVLGSRVVLPTDMSVIRPVGYSRLVLSACTPLFSASHRLIVFAKLSAAVPLGAARLAQAPPRNEPAGTDARSGREGLPAMLKASQRVLPPLVS
jgi:sortase A